MAQEERQTLLAVTQALPEEQFQALKFLLEGQIPAGLLLPASPPELCRLLLQRFPGQTLPVLAGPLRQLGRLDLCQRFQLPLEEPTLQGIPNGDPGAAPHPTRSQQVQLPQGAPQEPNGAPSLGSSSTNMPPNPSGNCRLLTEKDLIQIAQKLGKEWQQVGIVCLELEQSRLEQIQEENPGQAVLWSFQMLREWQRRERHEATARRLRSCLENFSVDPGIFQLLQSLEGP